MLKRLKEQPLAFVAVFLLVVGTAIAAPTPGGPDNTPNPPPVVTGKHIKNGSIGPRDLQPDLLDELSQPGPTGAKGKNGPPGKSGPTGLSGPRGTAGPSGPEGADGLDGTDGSSGQIGPQGPQGNPGPTGQTGGIGPTGQQGPAGTPDGASVMMGRIDPTGVSGDCISGSPVGLSVTGVCSDAGRLTRMMPVPVGKSLRNFILTVDSAIPAIAATVAIVNRGVSTSTNVATCTIGAGATACLIEGPLAIGAGTRLVVEVDFNGGTPQGAMFGYELYKP